MADEEISQFFTVNNRGNSEEVHKTIIDGLEALRVSEIRARSRQYKPNIVSPILVDGIPGIPFEKANSNPDIFYQGEDIIYDAVLIYNGNYVNTDDHTVLVCVKKTPRDPAPSWEGFLDNGVYEDKGVPGKFEFWIPSAVSSNFLAGSYFLQVQLQEKIGKGLGRFDRRYIILETYFNIDYGNFSPAPESRQPGAAQQLRNNLTATWPNAPDTVGKSPIPDVINERFGVQ